jgi:hypothetical protein
LTRTQLENAVVSVRVHELAMRIVPQAEADVGASQCECNRCSWELDLRSGVRTWSDEHFRLFGLESARTEFSMSQR